MIGYYLLIGTGDNDISWKVILTDARMLEMDNVFVTEVEVVSDIYTINILSVLCYEKIGNYESFRQFVLNILILEYM